MNMLKRNARLLNPRKTTHCNLELDRQAALAAIARYNDAPARRWLARVEEAIARRAAGHLAYLLAVAEARRKNGHAGAEYFEQRAAEVAALKSFDQS